MKIHVTKKQQNVLDFIKAFSAERGYPPTRKEIATHFGWQSVNAVVTYMRTLESKGLIKIQRYTSRGIRVVEMESDKQVTITRRQYRQLCNALINAGNMREQLLMITANDRQSSAALQRAQDALQVINEQLKEAAEVAE